MVYSLIAKRKFWLGIFGVGLFLFSILSFGYNEVFAQTLTENQQTFYDTCLTRLEGIDIPDENKEASCRSSALAIGETETLPEKNPALSNLDCSFPNGLTGCPEVWFRNLSQIIVELTALLLGVGGLILNYTIEYTILGAHKNIVGDENVKTGIQTAWTLIRDLINMSFIFILLYQAIKMIIGQASDAQKVIVKVVAVALLINFSMFITRVVVDASNIVSIGFYDAIAIDQDSSNGGLSAAYMQALGIQDIWNDGILVSLTGIGDVANANKTIITQNLMMIVFITVTAFVFIAASIMFIVRYIIIILLMILSPLALAGYILPGTKSQSDKWWQMLTSQAIFAPAFIIMTWVNLTFLSAIVPDKNLSAALTGLGGGGANFDPSVISSLFNFSLVIGMAIASLVISKQIATKGGAGFGKLNSFIGGAALGATAWGGRQTFGRFGSSVASSQSLKDRAAKGGVRGFMAKQALVAGDRTAKGSLDVRGTKLGGTVFDNMGKASKTSYHKAVDDKAKKEFEFAKSLGADPQKTAQNNIKISELQAKEAERQEKIKEIKKEMERKKEKGEDVSGLEARLKIHQKYSKINTQDQAGLAAEKTRRMREYKDNVLDKGGTLGYLKRMVRQTEKERGVDEPLFAVSREAARKIDKELNKSNAEKELDKLLKGLKDEKKKSGGDDSGGDDE